MSQTYDPRCDELARVFLEDDPTNTAETEMIFESRVAALAGEIQEAIEGWLEANPAADAVGEAEE